MRVAIVHYHLSPGGVSTVITAASEALTAAGVAHVILVGSAPATDLPMRIVPGLAYLKQPAAVTSSDLLDQLRTTANSALGGPPDLWHFHNHSLGKNVLLPAIVSQLARDRDALLLQLHDLAEDGRPQNYPSIPDPRVLYPVSPRIRYAFLNPGDQHHFVTAGLPAENAVLLPNSIHPPAPVQSPRQGSPLVLYPSRGIRRKNLGEVVLLSLLAPPGTRFAITREPENSEAQSIHHLWKNFACRHRLPVDFNVVDRLPPPGGSDASFASWVERSTHWISTSVSEGFGLIPSEAAAFGKPLIARSLRNQPVKATHAYDRILIPREWIDEAALRKSLEAALTETYGLYQQPLARALIDETADALNHGAFLDFANLPEAFQQSILRRLMEQGGSDRIRIQSGEEIDAAEHWLAAALAATGDELRSSILSTDDRQPLTALYAEISSAPPSPPHHLDPRKVLARYLNPQNFHFLLTAPSPPIRAVIFDIYGTLLTGVAGGVKVDPDFDAPLRTILESFGLTSPASPTRALHEAVLRHHQASPQPYPEIDLRQLWEELLPIEDATALVQAIEDAWHPVEPMPGASETLHHLADRGLLLGLLSNAQVNTLPSLDRALGPVSHLFEPLLTLLSYQHRIAKPSPELYQLLVDRLAKRGIRPQETLFVGNDPAQDIQPAAAAGFRTALFIGHPDSLRPGHCTPDFRLESLSEITSAACSPSSDPLP